MITLRFMDSWIYRTRDTLARCPDGGTKQGDVFYKEHPFCHYQVPLFAILRI
jgi:hypothetical protein